MFKVSKVAGRELKRSMAAHDFDDMPLRVAARRLEDGSIDYQMGFDEAGPGDTMVASSGIDVVIAREHLPLLQGTELDFVELDDDGYHFIFKNPNDANYVMPDESDGTNDATTTAATPSDEVAARTHVYGDDNTVQSGPDSVHTAGQNSSDSQ